MVASGSGAEIFPLQPEHHSWRVSRTSRGEDDDGRRLNPSKVLATRPLCGGCVEWRGQEKRRAPSPAGTTYALTLGAARKTGRDRQSGGAPLTPLGQRH